MDTKDTKTCTDCKKEKPLTEYHRRGIRLQNICKHCRNAKARFKYNATGKARTTSPIQINKSNIPTLSERITILEKQLKATASQYATDKQEADDLYSEIVESILTKTKPTDTNSYMLTHAKLTALEYVNRKSTYNHYVGSESDEVFIKKISVEDELIENELSDELKSIIAKLPIEYRRVVSMLAVGYNQKEIAKNLHVSEPVVSKKIQRIGSRMLQLGFSFG